MLKNSTLLFIVSFFTFQLAAQETPVTFRITNKTGSIVPFASVTVIKASDTADQKLRVSDSAGIVRFRLSAGQNYMVRVNSVNYEPLEKGISVKNSNSVFPFILTPADASLKGVVVTSRKPLMRQEDDKTIVDPENLAQTSTSAYEIVEKTPGLFVDQDGNIYLNSTTPASIQINGREQRMSAADIASLLKSLPPNSIASIEIVRTPSARYDASGAGGVVNVVLKKNVKIGLTGSLNTGMNQGRYGNQFFGFNLNNNNGAWTTYLNFQVSNRKTYERIRTDRFFAVDSMLSQDATTIFPTKGLFTGFGFNYQFNKKWELSYDGRISSSWSRNNSNNPSVIRKISTDQIITRNEAFVNNKGRNLNTSHGISTKYKIDSLGSEWTNDISFTYAPNNTDQTFNTIFYTPFSATTNGIGDIENTLRFLTAQTNFVKKLKDKTTLEAGAKTSNVWFDNSTAYFRNNNGTMVKDNIRTRSYKYEENIHSAYLQASRPIAGFILKAGIRMENTNMNGRQLIPNDTSFTQHRTDFFPYIYLSRNLFKIAGYDMRAYLVHRRTISRPAYEYLNPSVRLVDQYLFETGNPSLRPQFNKNYEANISVNEYPILAIGFNDTKDIFNQVIYQADSTKSVAYRTYDNLGTNKETYFRAVGALPPGKKYFFVAGVQYNHNYYQGLYEGKPLSFKRGSWSVFSYHTFRIRPNTQLSLNGFARFKGQLQFYELGSFGSLNFNVTQNFLNKKLTITASVNDVFFTNKNDFYIQQGSITANGSRYGDSRRFGLNIRYNFGIRKKEENNLFNVESPEQRSN